MAVVNAPGRNASAVAEFTIGAILAETRLITKGHVALRQGVWRGDLYRADLTGEELSELTVGIIGYGHIGTRWSACSSPSAAASWWTTPTCGSRPRMLPTAWSRSVRHTAQGLDVVSLHARVTPETTASSPPRSSHG